MLPHSFQPQHSMIAKNYLEVFHRASAACFALSLRCFFVMVSMLRFPPILPPFLPSADMTADMVALSIFGSGASANSMVRWIAANAD